MNCLVTGGAGFIGSNLIEHLLKKGYKVRVLDNLSTGQRKNLFRFIKDIEFIEGDIRSYHIVQKAVQEIDYIFHQAALPSVPRSIEDPITTNEVNVGGTLNILDAAKDSGVKKVVYASSSSIYGESEQLPKHEEMTPNPMSPYAASKLAGEKYCQIYTRVYGLETISLRYFNVFGPNQDPNSQYSAVIPKFITAIQKGKAPIIYGDGEQSRDFTYVDNVVHANLLAIELQDGVGELYNVACQRKITVNELFQQLKKFIKSSANAIYESKRLGDVKHSYADITKIQKVLNYNPVISFEDGLLKTFQHFQSL